MEVIYDLDTEARLLSSELDLNMERAATAGTHRKFVSMIRELIVERMEESPAKRVVGIYPANPDVCLIDCCPAPVRPAMPAVAATTA
jgi:ferrochelatase